MASAKDIAKALFGVIGENDDEATVKHWLDSGFPPLNNASSSSWNGCFPVGRMVEIAGPPSSGKTAIATAAMAAAQKLGGIAGFMDHERSFSLKLAPRLGLDTTPGRLVYRKPETFEQSIAIFATAVKTIRDKKLIAPDAPICWVWDSLAAMTPHALLYDDKGKPREIDKRNMKDKLELAVCTSTHFPSVAQISEDYGVCSIFLNQMRNKIGISFGDPRKTTGGDAPEFYFSQRLWLSAAQIKLGTDVIGMEVTGGFRKNKVNRPFQTAKWRFMFQPDGTGRFDRERSLVEFLNEQGLFEGEGTKYTNEKGEEKSVKKGHVLWEGKQLGREALARQIEAEGDAGFAKIIKLLPPEYSPPVVAEVDISTDEEDEKDAA